MRFVLVLRRRTWAVRLFRSEMSRAVRRVVCLFRSEVGMVGRLFRREIGRVVRLFRGKLGRVLRLIRGELGRLFCVELSRVVRLFRIELIRVRCKVRTVRLFRLFGRCGIRAVGLRVELLRLLLRWQPMMLRLTRASMPMVGRLAPVVRLFLLIGKKFLDGSSPSSTGHFLLSTDLSVDLGRPERSLDLLLRA